MENDELSQNRKIIDKIDETLMSLLDKRAEIVKIIREIKMKNNLPILNKERENEILEKTKKFDNNEFVNSLFIEIIEKSRKIQEKK